jgi:hypothetical protein
MTTDATRRRALNLRLDADTIHRLKRAALDRGTTASAIVERLVGDHLDDGRRRLEARLPSRAEDES